MKANSSACGCPPARDFASTQTINALSYKIRHDPATLARRSCFIAATTDFIFYY